MTKIVINTGSNGLDSLTAISASLNYDPCEVTRHDHRLVALVEFLQATTNDCATDLSVIEIAHGHRYFVYVRDDNTECVVHGVFTEYNWVDPQFDWDASSLNKPTVTKLDAGRFQTNDLTIKVPGVMSRSQAEAVAKINMSSLYGAITDGWLTSTLKEIAELSSGAGVQAAIRNLAKTVLKDVMVQAPVKGVEPLTDGDKQRIMLAALQSIKQLAKQNGSHHLVLPLAKTALNEFYGPVVGIVTEAPAPTNEELLDGAMTCISRGLAFRGITDPIAIAIHAKGLLTIGISAVTIAETENEIMRAALEAIESLSQSDGDDGPGIARTALEALK